MCNSRCTITRELHYNGCCTQLGFQMMKNISKFILVLFILSSCDKEENLPKNDLELEVLPHASLGFQLDKPDVILNEIATGELNRDIRTILQQSYDQYFANPVEHFWEFKYQSNSDRVEQMTYYKPHYSDCEKTVYNFDYNSDNYVSSAIATKTNVCNQYEFVSKFTFNYSDIGLLESIFMKNESFVQENYFGYYPNGKIKEIYNDYRSSGDEIYFRVQKFYWDEDFENVIMIENIGRSDYYTFTYDYDDKKNPFKGLFISVSEFMPHFGPAYLSRNNIVGMIRKNENNVHGSELKKEYTFDYNGEYLMSYTDRIKSESQVYTLYSINN
jgi:hypothetical protein